MDVKERRKLLGQLIRQKRLEADYSQREFAAIASTEQSYLWKVEHGRTSVGLDVLCHIADALDMPVRDLIRF